jgi:hypothetical protein
MTENGGPAKEDSSLLYKSMLNTTLGLGEFNQYSYLFDDEDDGDDDSLLASPSRDTDMKDNAIKNDERAKKEKENGNKTVAVAGVEHTPISEPKSISQITNRNHQMQNEWENQQKETQELEEKLSHVKIQVSQQESQWKQERERLLSPLSTSTKRRNLDKDPVMLLQLEREKRMEIEVQYNALKQQQQSTNSNLMSPLRLDTLKQIQKAHISEIEQLHQQVDTIQAQHAQEKRELDQALHQEQREKEKLQKEKEGLKTALLKEQETSANLKNASEQEYEKLKHQMKSLECQKEELDEAFQKEQQLKQELEIELQRLSEEFREQQQAAQESLALKHKLEKMQEETTKDFKARIQGSEEKHEHEQNVLKKQIETYCCQIDELNETYTRKVKEWQALLDKESEQDTDDGCSKQAQSNDTQSFEEHVQQIETEHAQEIHELRQRLENEKEKTVDCSADFETSRVEASSPFNRCQKDAMVDHSIALSPIFPLKASQAANFGGDENEDDGNDRAIDALLDEIGQMDREREELLKEVQEDTSSGIKKSPEAQEPTKVGESINSTGDNSSHILDRTLTLLTNLKDLMDGQGEENEKEASVLEQLEVLSEMMQGESTVAQTSFIDTTKQEETANQLVLFEKDETESSLQLNSSLLVRNKPSLPPTQTQENPWPALVEELRNRIRFLEHDRSELARISDEMIQRDRESHKLQADAAVATAKRESLEQLRLVQLDTREQMKTLYNALCVHCQRKVYARD